MSLRRVCTITLFSIICFVLNTITSAEERIAIRKHYAFPSKTELFVNPKIYRLSDEYHNLTYVLCDDYEDLPTSERNCTVVQDTQPEKSCPVTLKTFNNGNYGADYLEVFPFGSTRAVILWVDYREPGFIMCTIVDFTTCKSKDVVLMEISSDYSKAIQSSYFADYDDSFEIVILSIPFGKELHKYHIDAEGNIVSKLAPWDAPSIGWSWSLLGSTAIFRAVAADSKLKAYLYFAYHNDGYQMLLVKPDGSRKSLAALPYSVMLEKKVVSTAHETIGVALPDKNNHVVVLLFDQEDKLKLNTSLQYHTKMNSLALLNLADGGFLILFATGTDQIKDDWELRVDAYYLTRVDAEGKVVGSIKIESEPNCRGKHREGLGIQVFENEAKEYCVVVQCSLFFESLFMGLTSSGAQFELLVKCFTEDDFSKSKTVI